MCTAWSYLVAANLSVVWVPLHKTAWDNGSTLLESKKVVGVFHCNASVMYREGCKSVKYPHLPGRRAILASVPLFLR